jgi:hypothetical protein
MNEFCPARSSAPSAWLQTGFGSRTAIPTAPVRYQALGNGHDPQRRPGAGEAFPRRRPAPVNGGRGGSPRAAARCRLAADRASWGPAAHSICTRRRPYPNLYRLSGKGQSRMPYLRARTSRSGRPSRCRIYHSCALPESQSPSPMATRVISAQTAQPHRSRRKHPNAVRATRSDGAASGGGRMNGTWAGSGSSLARVMAGDGVRADERRGPDEPSPTTLTTRERHGWTSARSPW